MPRGWVPVVGVIWLGAASTGLWVLWRYDNAPGQAAQAPDQWPTRTTLVRDGESTDARHARASAMHVHARELGELAEALARAAAGRRPTCCS